MISAWHSYLPKTAHGPGLLLCTKMIRRARRQPLNISTLYNYRPYGLRSLASVCIASILGESMMEEIQ